MGERPAGKPWHANTRLDHFCIVTWAMEPGRLAQALPAGLEPQVFEVEGRERSLASAVAFEDRDFHFKGCPFARISCGQINYRAYVRRGGLTGVYFFRTVLGSRWAVVPRRLWSMPWVPEPVAVRGRWEGSDVRALEVEAPGPVARTSIRLEGGEDPEVPPALFSSQVSDPALGWFTRCDGRLGRYSVWHPPLEARAARIVVASAGPFEEAGLVDPGQAPLGALAQRSVEFDVHLPPLIC
jgi:hypothetical protein